MRRVTVFSEVRSTECWAAFPLVQGILKIRVRKFWAEDSFALNDISKDMLGIIFINASGILCYESGGNGLPIEENVEINHNGFVDTGMSPRLWHDPLVTL